MSDTGKIPGKLKTAAELDRAWATVRIRAGVGRDVKIEAARRGKALGDFLTAVVRRGLDAIRKGAR